MRRKKTRMMDRTGTRRMTTKSSTVAAAAAAGDSSDPVTGEGSSRRRGSPGPEVQLHPKKKSGKREKTGKIGEKGKGCGKCVL